MIHPGMCCERRTGGNTQGFRRLQGIGEIRVDIIDRRNRIHGFATAEPVPPAISNPGYPIAKMKCSNF